MLSHSNYPEDFDPSSLVEEIIANNDKLYADRISILSDALDYLPPSTQLCASAINIYDELSDIVIEYSLCNSTVLITKRYLDLFTKAKKYFQEILKASVSTLENNEKDISIEIQMELRDKTQTFIDNKIIQGFLDLDCQNDLVTIKY